MANTFKLKNNAVMPSSTTTVVIGLTLANVHTAQVTASVTVIDSSNSDETSHVIKDAPIPVGGSLEIMSGNKIILETTDIIKVDCSVANKISATLSIMEIT